MKAGTRTKPVSRTAVSPWVVLAVLCAGFFMTLLDMTIVNVALPALAADLTASLDQLLWVLNGYTLALAVLLITAGRLGDLRGPRTMFVAGVAIFTVASALCGLAAGPGELIGARVLQGVGAAVLVPQTLTIIARTFPPDRIGQAIGVWGITSGLATAAGPTFGGILVDALDWRWIFFLNLPVGIAVVILALLFIPEQEHGTRRPLDLPGTVLVTAALLALTYGLIEGERYRWGGIWGPVSIPALIATGVVLLVLFLVAQARRQDREPLVPFALFAVRDFTLMNVVSTIVGGTLVGLYLIATIHAQSVLGLSALAAGLLLVPGALVAMGAAPVAGRLADRSGGCFVLVTGLSVYALGIAVFAWAAAAQRPWPYVLPGLILTGLGLGCTFAPMGAIAMRQVPQQISGAASGLLNATRQLGAVLGGAVVGVILQGRIGAIHLTEAATAIPALVTALRTALVVLLVLTVVAALLSLAVTSGRTGTRPHPARTVD